MKRFERLSFPDAAALARTAAADWLEKIAEANRAGGPHRAALSGGRIAREFFGAVAAAAQAGGVLFDSVHFFWADERCVPPADNESNFRLAQEHLLKPRRVSEDRIHRIHGEVEEETAAAEAEEALRRWAPRNGAGVPVLDLVFLGMGEDGHVASLFPAALPEQRAAPWVYRAVTAPKPPPRRITLGYGPISAAQAVWVLASGPGKERALQESLAPAGQTPLAEVLRRRAQTRIYTDIGAS
ncbi:MAG: 6-phosphogluconolactonase [Chloroflexi bacterium]|nr:6-phosphogluconolactonase [Chloroflexota bacterium]